MKELNKTKESEINMKVCKRLINTIVNPFGETEEIRCTKPQGHKYVCGYRPDYSVFGDDKKYVASKINNMAYSTAGSTASNSPILHRGSRFNPPRVISKEEEILLKEQKKFRQGVRKDEVSTFKLCHEVEQILYDTALSIYNGDGCQCPLCGDEITWEQFVSKERTNGLSIQGCHLDPLEEGVIRHYPGNVMWGHRDCNQIQGDRALVELIDYVNNMVEHLKKVNHDERRVNEPSYTW